MMMIRVVRGNPSREELAAALAVVRARAAAPASGPPGAAEPAPEWSAPDRIARAALPRPGPRAWAHTYWPG